MATILFEEIVFGPIRSRRLGSSLGINLLPRHGKWCNFDCIYCECGWNKDGLKDKTLPTLDEVREALERRLNELKAEGTHIDTITFSGNGEPTAHPDFAAIIDHTVELRDRLYPEAVISVLSNASNLHKPAVCEALKKVNNPILKVDGCTESFVNDINKPAPGYSLERTLNNLESFHGDFILQTMFLKGEIDGRPLDSTEASEVAGWQAIVRRLRPREIMRYTLDRETPMSGLRKVTIEEMEAIAAPLREEGFQIQIRG